MITEDYVSFETAKLLKEKGFKEPCHAYYDKFTTNNFHDGCEPTDFNSIDFKIRDIVSAPTLQLAAKWLRAKNIFITIFHYNSNMAPFVWLIFAYNVLIPQTAETYEEAAEAAINYILNHWDEVNSVLNDYYKQDKYLPKI